ncbi:hypothetical protein ACMA1I_04515 [Pontibacter sp. 13R65]|uniref:DUF7793 family protein n=1 Tax=Pontibacter sp. 13R65 TaxID=3127458 RepID=UPI00301E2094
MTNLGRKNDLQTKDSKYVYFRFADGILECYVKEIELLDLPAAKVCVQDRLEFIQNKSYPSLFDITKVKKSTKEARDFMADQGNELVTASAILVTSPVLRMMANFFISVNKPKNPSRMFTDKQAALEWLAQFKGSYCLALLATLWAQVAVIIAVC